MSRSIDKTVTVSAPPEAVWRALTDAEELKRWFPVDARVTPGAGGSIWISWGDGMEGEAPITAWEPGRRFQWTQDRGAVKMAVDFHIEGKGGTTVVRLVQSGFGDGPEWDDEFHMTSGGWSYFLQHLRWYLERHAGVPRDVLGLRDAVPLSRSEAFDRLIGPSGLSRERSLLSTPVGQRFETTTAAGDRISGTVLTASASTGQFGFTIRELNDAVLFLEMEPHEGGTRPGFWLSTYGLDVKQLADVRTRFAALYRGAFQTAERPV